MLWFFFCLALLVLAYFTYGKIVEKIFVINPNRKTPAHELADGVDYMSMSNTKVFLIQLLNIAGLGPVFGPILGALYGPVAMLWIVIGCIFAGAVHDYFSGMLSVRSNGASVPSVVGDHLGKWAKHFMNVFALLLLVLVGVVFVTGPAKLLSNLTSLDVMIWVGIIFAYYILATLMPISKIIGRLYPFFGALLLFMSFGLTIGLMLSDKPFYSYGLDFMTNFDPKGLPIWPLLFVTISCGAISGFHATQSPLMARCIADEKSGRMIFYGAMILEGAIALIWCTLGLSFYESSAALQEVISKSTPAGVVHEISIALLGGVGGIIAILGVVILPITSGDTAFRSARLIIADFFNMQQKDISKRLLISIPLFAVGIVLSQVDFQTIWRYFGWANQTTAAIMLWTASAYLYKSGKFHWIATIPALFMTTVVTTYLAYEKIGFRLDMTTSTIIGVISSILVLVLFFRLPKSTISE
ncbi:MULTISPECIES: carbon starvation CstA family protein [unclassified Campylobacter]|uniref:carbon starvation CstA family protein n=1 Tax=unclassified Campylobacter TaxID=2593542 RepID=UPI003D336346